MGRFVVKVAPDANRYIVWSTSVDDIVHVGTRDETAEYLADEMGRRPIEESLQRADVTGSSSMRHRWIWGDLDTLITAQGKPLLRSDIGEYAASWLMMNDDPDPHADCMPGWCVLPPSDPRHENHPAPTHGDHA